LKKKGSKNKEGLKDNPNVRNLDLAYNESANFFKDDNERLPT